MALPKKEKPRLAVSARKLVAYNLRRVRLERSWQQELLSYEAGLHRTMVGYIESAKKNVTVDTLEALVGALKIEMHELFLPIPSEDSKQQN